MGKRSAAYTKAGAESLANDKPALYRITSASGKQNYVGVAKRGRVSERVAEHIGEIPGAYVSIEQFHSIANAKAKESRVLKRSQPKYNKQSK